MSTHYIALGGFSGYLPQSCEVFMSKEDALENLEYYFSLDEKQLKEVKKIGIVYKNTFKNTFIDSGDYCEIQECTCNTPWVHSSDMDEVTWKNLYGEEKQNDNS